MTWRGNNNPEKGVNLGNENRQKLNNINLKRAKLQGINCPVLTLKPAPAAPYLTDIYHILCNLKAILSYGKFGDETQRDAYMQGLRPWGPECIVFLSVSSLVCPE